MATLLKKAELPAQRAAATKVIMKNGGKPGVLKAQCAAVFDISGSTDFPNRQFYTVRRGNDVSVMSGIATRMLALGMQLDDNGSVPVVKFSSSAKTLPEVTQATLETYVATHFPKGSIGGGTCYPAAMKEVMKSFSNTADPGLVWFFTDGECNAEDVEETKRLIKQYSSKPVFWSFVGIHVPGDKPDFGFLNELDNLGGRVIDNAGFFEVNVETITDEELYTAMLGEFTQFPGRVAASNGKVRW